MTLGLISIHALREEGDPTWTASTPQAILFLSTPSARRATADCYAVSETAEFLSTPSARRATSLSRRDRFAAQNFYPRPPRGGRRGLGLVEEQLRGISIHALREEGDDRAIVRDHECRGFLSTPSARRATCRGPAPRYAGQISIHPLREEGDLDVSFVGLFEYDFYPRPPRGGRQE